ncbi:hypothetical protein VTK73DRAFT_4661 [Phialemonium thermophilum]|uniref:Uncharacterized protein n=1 Tax=Phialemonium thermophilum TaxID=223376 RepID=A0ABR3V731_9PEZI
MAALSSGARRVLPAPVCPTMKTASGAGEGASLRVASSYWRITGASSAGAISSSKMRRDSASDSTYDWKAMAVVAHPRAKNDADISVPEYNLSSISGHLVLDDTDSTKEGGDDAVKMD